MSILPAVPNVHHRLRWQVQDSEAVARTVCAPRSEDHELRFRQFFPSTMNQMPPVATKRQFPFTGES